MPRIKQYAEMYAIEAFLRDIREKQGYFDLMNVRALSDASGIPYQTLLRRLQNPNDFTILELRKLNAAIKLNPITILEMLGFSKKEINQITVELRHSHDGDNHRTT